MGGNALKNIQTKRIDPKTYQRIKLEITNKLTSNGFTINDIIEVPGKESYGDLDLLWWQDDMTTTNIKDIVKQLFNPQEMVLNGEVLSWDYENFQIDLIKCLSLEQMKFARFYFSYGDVGSILGRFCNYHGLKIGHRGFWIDVYECTLYPEKQLDPTRNVGEVLLTMEPEEACKYLGLDWNIWIKGFNTMVEIFDWIKTSKYFVVKIFGELNGEHMRRAKLRPMYMKFVEYIGMKPLEINGKPEIRYNLQQDAIKYFNKLNEIEKIKNKIEYNQIIKNKFCGKKLLEKGIEGKNIGVILKMLEDYINKNYQMKFTEWIYHTEQKEIDILVEHILYQFCVDSI